MADIDLAALTPRGRALLDHVVVLNDGSPEEMALIPIGEFLEILGGALTLPAIATPPLPPAGNVSMFARSVGGRILPAFVGPFGLDSALQPHIGRNKVARWSANGNGTTSTTDGINLATAQGNATGHNWNSGSIYGVIRKIEYLVTTAAVGTIAQQRGNAAMFSVGGAAANRGGFHFINVWGPATGVTNPSHRGFCGFRSAANATDVDPSTLTNMVGMGWDAADANVQMMHNDGSGVATKIDLGAAFPKPNADRTTFYRLTMFSPPGTIQVVGYEVENLTTGAVATGAITADLPAASTGLCPATQMTSGGVSSVIGIAVSSLYIETDY